jgi:hypothetical protein
MKRNYRHRLDRLEQAVRKPRYAHFLPTDPRALALWEELCAISARLEPEGGWESATELRQALLYDDRARTAMADLSDVEAGLVVPGRENEPTETRPVCENGP